MPGLFFFQVAESYGFLAWEGRHQTVMRRFAGRYTGVNNLLTGVARYA
jgi:hypothetical protein